MAWRLALALLDVVRLIAQHVAQANAEQAAEAKLYLKQMEKADAAIAKARAARDRAVAGGVRDSDPNSRD